MLTGPAMRFIYSVFMREEQELVYLFIVVFAALAHSRELILKNN
jgi:hypothetical protein